LRESCLIVRLDFGCGLENCGWLTGGVTDFLTTTQPPTSRPLP